MPMDYEIDTRRGAVLMRGWGRLTNDEMLECIARLRADADLKPGMSTLSDMREVTEMAINFDGMIPASGVMTETRVARGPARIAIVVSSLPDEKMAKLLAAVSQSDNPEIEIRPFRSYEAAASWLGLAAA